MEPTVPDELPCVRCGKPVTEAQVGSIASWRGGRRCRPCTRALLKGGRVTLLHLRGEKAR